MIHRLFFLLACFLLAACQPAPTESYKPAFSDTPPAGGATLVFGVHPMHSPQRLFEVYQPLVDYLNRNMPEVRLRLEVSRDYGEFERRLASRHFHFALPNPYQTVVSWKHGYRVIGKLGDDDTLRGVLIVRRDSGIEQPKDLKGKAVSYPAPTALAATMLPQWFLHEAGVNVRSDLQNHYVGTQESSIMNVYLGKTAAGATWLAPWIAFTREHPDIAAQLELKWKTPPLVNYSLVARSDVLPDIAARVQELMIGLDGHEEGRNILARMELSRFDAADDRVYQPVVAFVERFEREVRPAREP